MINNIFLNDFHICIIKYKMRTQPSNLADFSDFNVIMKQSETSKLRQHPLRLLTHFVSEQSSFSGFALTHSLGRASHWQSRLNFEAILESSQNFIGENKELLKPYQLQCCTRTHDKKTNYLAFCS